MSPHEIFQIYSRERRTLAPSGFRLERLDHLVRLTPLLPDLDGIVLFSELPNNLVDAAITEQLGYFADLQRAFEWKVYSFDTPLDLSAKLVSRGFIAGEAEAFMVYPVDAGPKITTDDSIRIERVTSEVGFDHVVSVQQQVWARPFPWLKHSLHASLERTTIFCAYIDGAPVGTGWIEFPEHSSFAELHGGAVMPQVRGRGVYSALFRARVLEARRRHLPFIAVDAAPLSRPILLRKGFQYICETIPFRSNSDSVAKTSDKTECGV